MTVGSRTRVSQQPSRSVSLGALTLATSLLLALGYSGCRRVAQAPAPGVAAAQPAPSRPEKDPLGAEDGPHPTDDLEANQDETTIPTGDPALPAPTAPRPETSAGSDPGLSSNPNPNPDLDGSDPPFRLPLDPRETSAERVATRLANTSPAQCRAELKQRKLAVTHVGGSTPGVATPVRLTGNLEGLRFLTPGRKSVYGVLDCRLSLVLDELAKVLADSGVTAIHIDNMYRPKAHLPGSKKNSQHAYGLAVDIYGFTLSDGTTLVVERDFGKTLGEAPCGPTATLPPGSDARTVSLRNLFCTIARARLFNYLLTPNYDEAHKDHIHADIQRRTRVRVVR